MFISIYGCLVFFVNGNRLVTLCRQKIYAASIIIKILNEVRFVICGACGNKGHSRSMKCCPLYYDGEEVERRNAAKMVMD